MIFGIAHVNLLSLPVLTTLINYNIIPSVYIRYQKGGVPLLSSDINIPPPSVDCISCGGNSTFEFQIMPQLVYLLQESMGHYTSALELPGDNTLKSLEIDSYLKVVEFGTVLVYTCDKSCWIDNNLEQNCFKEEVVCVQPET